MSSLEFVPGILRSVTGRGGSSPGQGPFLNVSLTVRESTILTATYDTYQCPGCHACGKAIVELVSGKSPFEASAIRHDALVEKVGPLAPHRRHCYGLALLALTDALHQLDSGEQLH